MRELKIKVYQYEELNDKAKEKARNWFIESSMNNSWAWDNTKEDAKQIGLIISSLDDHKANSGKFEKSALDTAERILKDHGNMCETFKTASKYVEKLRQFSEDDTDETSAEYDALKDLESEFLADILEDYRIYLNSEYEYQSNEEYIAETMEANAYEFTEDGKRV